jgi:hypothetical protein
VGDKKLNSSKRRTFPQIFNIKTLKQPSKNSKNSRPKISILSSLFQADAQIKTFFQDITKQSYFAKSELLLGLVEPTSPYVNQVVERYSSMFDNIRIIRFYKKEPLYVVWNALIRGYARGEFLINANADDRHDPRCLQIFSDFLDKHTNVSLIAAPVKVTSDQASTWDKAQDIDNWWTVEKPFRLVTSDFFKFDDYGRIRTTQNLPHR